MPKNESGDYVPGTHVAWCINNNRTAYRELGLSAPAEAEVSSYLYEEFSLHQKAYMFEHGVNLEDAPDEEHAAAWLENREFSQEFYDKLKMLEDKIYDIHQIASVLYEACPAGVITYHLTSVRPLRARLAYRHWSQV